MIVAEPELCAVQTEACLQPAGRGKRSGMLARLGWLAPSFADCFFLAILIWLFVAGASGWKALLMDGDTGWHIRTGEYILDHGRIPHADLFSYSKPGAPWFAWEWLSDIVFALLFRAAGLKGVVLFCGVLIAGVATLLLRYTLWRGSNGLIALGTTLLAVGSSSIHFLARPHLFTLFFLPVSIWILQRDREGIERGRSGRAVWLLIPLVAIWTNLHGGFVVLLVCLGLLVFGCALERRHSRARWVAVRRYSGLLAGCSAATLCNPYGLQLHSHIWSYLRADWIRNLVQEFQAPTFRNEGQMQFELLLMAGLIVAGVLILRRKAVEPLWLIFLAHSSLTSVRHAPLFAVVAAPLVALELSRLWRTRPMPAKTKPIGRILFELGEDLRPAFRRSTVWAMAGVVALAVLGKPLVWPVDFPNEAFPTGLIHRHQDLLSHGRVFTTDQWADYLIYSFYPGQRVFIDGRSDFYGEALGREYLSLLEGSYRTEHVMQERGFDVLLLPVESSLAELVKRQSGWRIVEDDGRAILFAASSRESTQLARAAR